MHIPAAHIPTYPQDFNECIVRLATMKTVPTDAEAEEGGFADEGEMVLVSSRAHAHVHIPTCTCAYVHMPICLQHAGKHRRICA